MNKFVKWITMLMLLFALSACGSQDNQTNNNSEEINNETTEEVNEQTVSITISMDEGEETISEKEVPIEDGAILMDIMKENFDVEESDGFITAIEGVEQNEEEKKAWMYFVNGEMAPVGANEYELSAGDEVSFDLQSWE